MFPLRLLMVVAVSATTSLVVVVVVVVVLVGAVLLCRCRVGGVCDFLKVVSTSLLVTVYILSIRSSYPDRQTSSISFSTALFIHRHSRLGLTNPMHPSLDPYPDR